MIPIIALVPFVICIIGIIVKLCSLSGETNNLYYRISVADDLVRHHDKIFAALSKELFLDIKTDYVNSPIIRVEKSLNHPIFKEFNDGR